MAEYINGIKKAGETTYKPIYAKRAECDKNGEDLTNKASLSKNNIYTGTNTFDGNLFFGSNAKIGDEPEQYFYFTTSQIANDYMVYMHIINDTDGHEECTLGIPVKNNQALITDSDIPVKLGSSLTINW